MSPHFITDLKEFGRNFLFNPIIKEKSRDENVYRRIRIKGQITQDFYAKKIKLF